MAAWEEQALAGGPLSSKGDNPKEQCETWNLEQYQKCEPSNHRHSHVSSTEPSSEEYWAAYPKAGHSKTALSVWWRLENPMLWQAGHVHPRETTLSGNAKHESLSITKIENFVIADTAMSVALNRASKQAGQPTQRLSSRRWHCLFGGSLRVPCFGRQAMLLQGGQP